MGHPAFSPSPQKKFPLPPQKNDADITTALTYQVCVIHLSIDPVLVLISYPITHISATLHPMTPYISFFFIKWRGFNWKFSNILKPSCKFIQKSNFGFSIANFSKRGNQAWTQQKGVAQIIEWTMGV